MKAEEMKVLADALGELNESYTDMARVVRGTTITVKATKKLWKGGRRSVLIKVGLA